MKKQFVSLGAACATLPLVLITATPADAATRWTYRSTSLHVEASLVLAGDVVDGFQAFQTGTVHASSEGYVEGYLSSWSCPEGEYPPFFGEDSEPSEPTEPETGCTYEGSRDFYGESADVAISKKLTAATVSGDVTVFTWSGEEEEPTSEPGTVDLTFTGAGGTYTTTEYSKGDGYVYKYESTRRDASVTGSAAGVSLDGADSWGTIASTKAYERYVSK